MTVLCEIIVTYKHNGMSSIKKRDFFILDYLVNNFTNANKCSL